MSSSVVFLSIFLERHWGLCRSGINSSFIPLSELISVTANLIEVKVKVNGPNWTALFHIPTQNRKDFHEISSWAISVTYIRPSHRSSEDETSALSQGSNISKSDGQRCQDGLWVEFLNILAIVLIKKCIVFTYINHVGIDLWGGKCILMKMALENSTF